MSPRHQRPKKKWCQAPERTTAARLRPAISGFLLFAALVMALGQAHGQAPAPKVEAGDQAADTKEAPPLRVVVAGSPPFTIFAESAKRPTGICPELWSAIARELGRTSVYVRANNTEHSLAMLENGEADVAIGPLSITSKRAERVAFSQPYFNAGLAILSPVSSSILDRIKPRLSGAFLAALELLLTMLLCVGTLLWLAERRNNPEQFPPGAVAGIGNGVWMALVTMTTVGYGDRVPRSTPGRIVAGFWMMASMLFASSVTAGLATVLTLSQLDAPGVFSAEDLVKRHIGVVEGTTSVPFVEKYRGIPRPTADVATAIEALKDKRVDAVVFDRPILRYHLKDHPEEPFTLSASSYQPEGYGFALPIDSPLRQAVDVAILHLNNNGDIENIVHRWLDP